MTAESNVLEGDNVICLGCFEQGRHSTLAQTPALRHWQLFLPVACSVARAQLDLPYAQYPLTPAEDAGIAAIPIVLSEGPLD